MAKKDWMVRESELDDDQIKVLMATLDKSIVVKGCAGSGKSVLALLKAQRVQNEKNTNSYNIIVFTKALCRYMNAGKELLGIKNDFNYHWVWKNRKKRFSVDYLIVDEIQDFSKEEIEQFIDASKKCFFFFGDTAQSIYGGIKTTLPVEDIRDLLPKERKPKEFELYRNYRLPIPVARIVQYVGVDLPPYEESTYKSQETALPRFIRYKSVEEQLKAIKRLIERDTLSDVAILLPHNDMVKQVSSFFKEIGLNHELKYENKEEWKKRIDNLNFQTTNPKVMTYHSAKGLQFETVFLPSILDAFSDDDRKALYVAMTRTYRYLYVMYDRELPHPLELIPNELYKTSESDLNDITDI